MRTDPPHLTAPWPFQRMADLRKNRMSFGQWQDVMNLIICVHNGKDLESLGEIDEDNWRGIRWKFYALRPYITGKKRMGE